MNEFLTVAQAIRDLVAKDHLRDAMNRLRKAVKDLPVVDKVITQQGRFEALRNDLHNDSLDPERAGVEKNRIRQNLLDIVSELEKEGKAQIQVFISYSQRGTGHELAKALHDKVEAEGFVAFLDTEDIQPGEDWVEFTLASLRASDYFVLLLSEEANTSEMVLKEIQEARQLKAQYGKPTILPVRIKWPESIQLNLKLSGWLNRIQHLYWEGTQDTEGVIKKLLNVISERQSLRLTEKVEAQEVESFAPDTLLNPLPEAPLEIPQGGVLLNSPYYIERQGEKEFIQKITAPKALLRIRGPRQYGKTSMLSRVVDHAREQGYEVVSMDFQNLSELTLNNSDNLIWEFAKK